MSNRRLYFPAVVAASAVLLQGCASTYGQLASSNGLGAAEYRPAVLVPPDRQAAYEQILQACRQASFNRQVTAAQKGQEQTLTSAVQGAADGASSGYQFSSVLKSAGYDSSTTRGFGVGAGIGLLGSLAGSFASGTGNTSDAVRATLLHCLRTQSAKVGYTVLE